MKRKNLYSILFALLLTACGTTTINPPTSVPTFNLPGLVVDSINVSNEQVYPYYLPLATKPDLFPCRLPIHHSYTYRINRNINSNYQ